MMHIGDIREIRNTGRNEGRKHRGAKRAAIRRFAREMMRAYDMNAARMMSMENTAWFYC